MTVYVDDMALRADVSSGHRTLRGRWSHLMADSTEELLEFAWRLDLRPGWIQRPGAPTEHCDVTASKRTAALRLGAVAIRYRTESPALVMCKRRGEPFDLEAVRQSDGHRPWSAHRCGMVTSDAVS
jgi:hypothetical protein